MKSLYAFLFVVTSFIGVAQTWEQIGPTDIDGKGLGMGAIHNIKINPWNPNTIYISSRTGGLWVSRDAGSSWRSLSDSLPNLDICDFHVHKSDTNKITVLVDLKIPGNGSGDFMYSTTNSGLTWLPVKFTGGYIGNPTKMICDDRMFSVSDNRYYPDYRYNGKIYVYRFGDLMAKTIGTSQIGPIKDFIWKPNTVAGQYIQSSDKFYRTLDSGRTFKYDSIPIWGKQTPKLEVTLADTKRVYALAINDTGASTGLYVTRNEGTSWSAIPMQKSINLLGTDIAGSSTTGTGKQNVCFRVSPTDTNLIFVGGKYLWRSSDAGYTWENVSITHGNSLSYTIYTIEMSPLLPNRVFVGTSRGVFVSTDYGVTWKSSNNKLVNADFVSMEVAKTKDVVIIASTETSTIRYENNKWTYTSDSVFKYFATFKAHKNVFYGITRNNVLLRSNDTAKTWNVINTPQGSVYYADRPFCFNTQNPQTIYAALSDVWKTSDGGETWLKHSTPFSAVTVAIAMSETDTNQILLFSQNNAVSSSKNGGITWDFLYAFSDGNPGPKLIIPHPKQFGQYYIASGVSPDEQEVYLSNNSGRNWGKISTLHVYQGLNKIINSLALQTDACGETVYIATNHGVHAIVTNRDIFRDKVILNSGIPPVNSSAIVYVNGNLYNATNGLGLWKYKAPYIGPQAQYLQDKNEICPGETIQFTNTSLFNDTQEWEFEEGTPPRSEEPNPIVFYTKPGTHNVKLRASVLCGTDTILLSSVIVLPILKSALQVNTNTVCLGDTVFVRNTTIGDHTPEWSCTSQDSLLGNNTLRYLVPTSKGTVRFSLKVSNSCGTSTTSQSIMVIDSIPHYAIQNTNNVLSVPFTSGYNYQWYANGLLIPSATASSFAVAFSGTYHVVVMNAAGCKASSDTISVQTTGIEVTNNDAVSVAPNPIGDEVVVAVQCNNVALSKIEVYSINGILMFRQHVQADTTPGSYFIPCSTLRTGTYIVRLTTSSGILYKKILKY